MTRLGITTIEFTISTEISTGNKPMKTTRLTDHKSATRILVRPPSTHLAPHCDTPKALLEGVTLCPTCNGAGYELLDPYDARRCCQCNGDGTAR